MYASPSIRTHNSRLWVCKFSRKNNTSRKNATQQRQNILVHERFQHNTTNTVLSYVVCTTVPFQRVLKHTKDDKQGKMYRSFRNSVTTK